LPGASSASPAPPSEAGTWIWPLRAPASLRATAWSMATTSERLTQGWRWVPAATLAGTVPFLLSYWHGHAWHGVVSGYLLTFLLLGTLREDRALKGVALLGLGFLAHCALAIVISAHDPAGAAACMGPDPELGVESYWADQQRWITTGEDPEYEPAAWVPAHFQLLAAMIGLSYLSLGLIPLWQGFAEVDLMNFYVAQLIGTSHSTLTALALGWHAWSLARGICYTVFVYELASWSFARLTGRDPAPRSSRISRWVIGLAFFALDCGLKYSMLEAVRVGLEANLR
jgi:hypothetical protein